MTKDNRPRGGGGGGEFKTSYSKHRYKHGTCVLKMQLTYIGGGISRRLFVRCCLVIALDTEAY
jgi:hypothetical protein